MAMLTTKDVCEQLSISRSSVDRLVALGELPCYRFGKTKRYQQEDVDAYLESCRIKTVQPVPKSPKQQTMPQPQKRGRPTRESTLPVYYPGMKVV